MSGVRIPSGAPQIMNDKLTDYIKIYDDVVSPASCKHIIDQYESHQHLVEVHDNDLYKFHQLNLNHTDDLMALANAYVQNLVPYYEDYFNSLGLRQYVDIDNFEEVRIKKYAKGSGEQFRTHCDVMDKSSASRFAIAILYLNDNDGLTTFPHLNVGVPPKAGRVVIFPPTWMFPHNGIPPKDDDKYIMMTCLHYKG